MNLLHDYMSSHEDVKTSPAIEKLIAEIKDAGGYERSNLDKAYFIAIDGNPGRLGIHESWVMKLVTEGRVEWMPEDDCVYVREGG